jgi:hypothetical protein
MNLSRKDWLDENKKIYIGLTLNVKSVVSIDTEESIIIKHVQNPCIRASKCLLTTVRATALASQCMQ